MHPVAAVQVTPSVLTLLRQATSETHQRLESRIKILDPAFSRADYVNVIRRMYGIYRPLERSLRFVDGWNRVPVDLPSRMKTHLLQADLEALGVDKAGLAICRTLPPLRSLEAALGCLYVLEGATLGGQVISRELVTKLGIDATTGAAFFHSYGGEVKSRWREFTGAVTEFSATCRVAEIVTGASNTFAAFDDWFSRSYMPL
jgi:heme oxygenase